jgi:colicin import membrane protein
MTVQTKLSPKARTEAALRKAGAKAKPAKADPKAAAKADSAKARDAKELAAALAREVAVRDSANGARDALAASIRGRFTDHVAVSATDLAAVYPNAKTARNRAAELEAYRRTGQVLGTAQASRLLDAVLANGDRLRDAWASHSAIARRECREAIAAGTAKAAAAVGAVSRVLAAMDARTADKALRDEVKEAKAAADKADRKAAAAHKALANAGDDTPASVKKELQKAVTAADKAAGKAADVHKALAAKLPPPPAPPVRTPAAIVQDVKVAMGDADLPLAALAIMGRDLAARFRAAGDAKVADAIGKALEKFAA